jgi:hypothetical protein
MQPIQQKGGDTKKIKKEGIFLVCIQSFFLKKNELARDCVQTCSDEALSNNSNLTPKSNIHDLCLI